jgi:hypothetical protein
MGPDEYDKCVWDDKMSEAPNISLGQILNRSGVLCKEDVPACKRVSGKREICTEWTFSSVGKAI